MTSSLSPLCTMRSNLYSAPSYACRDAAESADIICYAPDTSLQTPLITVSLVEVMAIASTRQAYPSLASFNFAGWPAIEKPKTAVTERRDPLLSTDAGSGTKVS
jgi:hypothetical protein